MRARYVEEFGAKLAPHLAHYSDGRGVIYCHPEYEWATATPDDFELPEPLTMLEYKTASRWVRWNGTPPADYVLQVQWGLWVTGLQRGRLYVAFGEEDAPGGTWVVTSTGLWDFTSDAELQSEFLRVGRHFWERNVLAKVPPAMDAMNGRKETRA